MWGNKRPVIIAPAMNFMMYSNPSTQDSLDKIKEKYNVTLATPEHVTFASGEEGLGGLAEFEDIFKLIQAAIDSH